jgi:hypothetical protein
MSNYADKALVVNHLVVRHSYTSTLLCCASGKISPDPDPAFHVIPDPNPTIKAGQIST